MRASNASVTERDYDGDSPCMAPLPEAGAATQQCGGVGCALVHLRALIVFRVYSHGRSAIPNLALQVPVSGRRADWPSPT